MKLLKTLCLTSTLLFTTMVNAETFSVEEPYARATPPHTQNSAAFMHISNNSDKSYKLVAASSDIAERVELHSHSMSEGMMKMRQVDEIAIDASATIELKPGSFHVMFLGLKSPLVEGQSVKLTLYFNNGDKLDVDAPVKKINTQKMKHNH